MCSFEDNLLTSWKSESEGKTSIAIFKGCDDNYWKVFLSIVLHLNDADSRIIRKNIQLNPVNVIPKDPNFGLILTE